MESSSEILAKKLRKHVLYMTHNSGAIHIGSCFSVTDIISVIYEKILNCSPSDIKNQNRDKFILSKGHATAVLYAVLAEKGFFPIEWLNDYCKNDQLLAGHVIHNVPGVEISTGALGHGLSIACGFALAMKCDNKASKVYVVLGDGECNEGSVWEAAAFAVQRNLFNITVIIDVNGLQGFGKTSEVINLEPIDDKWRSFGWNVIDINGHSHDQIFKALITESSLPKVIIARTIKGKGVSFMENQLSWHYKTPNKEELQKALEELGN